MKQTKIHSVLKFTQSDWINKYTDFNTEKIKMLPIVLKRFFKLMINSVYGKTMEILRERISVKIMNNEKDYLKNTRNQLLFFQKSLVTIMLTFLKLNQS